MRSGFADRVNKAWSATAWDRDEVHFSPGPSPHGERAGRRLEQCYCRSCEHTSRSLGAPFGEGWRVQFSPPHRKPSTQPSI